MVAINLKNIYNHISKKQTNGMFMSSSLMPALPLQAYKHIVNFIHPEEITSIEIRRCGRDLATISLVNKIFYGIASEKLQTIKNIYRHYLKHKYRALSNYVNGRSALEGKTQLLAALFSGHEFFRNGSPFPSYTAEIREDIKAIVRLMPQSMDCIPEGSFIDSHSPLWAAIHRECPLSIIEFLLQQVPTPNALAVFRKAHDYKSFQNVEEALLCCKEASKEFVENSFAIQALLIKYGFLNPKATS
jgi:hypothetical protein